MDSKSAINAMVILATIAFIVGCLSLTFAMLNNKSELLRDAPREAVETRLKEIEIEERVIELRKEKGLE